MRAGNADIRALVSQAVERLPPAEREAIALYYFEGYAGDEAARFLDIPVGSLRRRLHDGRNRLRKYLTEAIESQANRPRPTQVHARVQALLGTDASQSDWYDLTREILLTRPVPHQLLATLFRGVSLSSAETDLGIRLLTRPQGPVLDDPGPCGEAARALRAALSDFDDWVVDTRAALRAFPNVFRQDLGGRALGMDPALMPPGMSSGEPGRYVRVTRGLLFGKEAAEVVDPAALLLRSDSPHTCTQGMHPAWLTDVLDVYWVEARPVELSEVEAWVTGLASQVVTAAQTRCSLHPALRYRAALRLTFAGDSRPAAIGGVLAGFPHAPDDVHVVHVRLYVEPWAQIRSGQSVPAQSIPGR